uniref:HAT C-terminal dimerisation domain-containing protein n=1 Tax=Latimeria chalumnae TaxID=7897 RepID=H3BDR6_LATCH
CTICRVDFSVAHGGLNDCLKHTKTARHLGFAKSTNCEHYDLSEKVTNAECLFTAFLVEHNVPLAVADHLSKLFKCTFPDLKVAQKYGKSSHIVKITFLPPSLEYVLQCVKLQPFALAIDSSSDESQKELVELVHFFDEQKGKVLAFFDFQCTAEATLKAVQETFVKNNIPWENAIAFSSDNASLMLGHHKVFTKIKEQNPQVWKLGCACHMEHICAQDAAKTLSVSVENFYYFEKSCKRKEELKQFRELCNVESRKILKHVSTQWLSLGKTLDRLLQQWPALKSYFSSQSQKDERVRMLNKSLSSPQCHLYCFLQSVIPIFDKFNLLMQSEVPMVHAIHPAILNLARDLLGRFLKPVIVREARDILSVQYENPEKQKADQDLYIGFYTKQYIHFEEMQDDTECDQYLSQFYKDVRNFYCKALSSVYKKLPALDETLKLLTITDHKNRNTHIFDDLVSLLEMFPCLKKELDMVKLEEEFINYQVPDTNALVEGSKEDGSQIRMDTFWHKIGQIKDPGSGRKNTFVLLLTVMKQLLVLSHSNADCERVFSVTRKNRAEACSELSNVVLKGLLETKVNMLSDCSCFKWNPSDDLIKKTKSA